MTSHDQLIKNFLTGKHNNFTDRNGHNMEIKTRDNHTIIEGYGHALYCLKYGGTVVLFNDWRDYSQTTAKHLTKIKGKARSDEHINLIVINNQFEYPEIKSKDSDKILKEIMCSYCRVQPTKKQNKSNGLRVCDKNKCNEKMAKGEHSKKVQPVL